MKTKTSSAVRSGRRVAAFGAMLTVAGLGIGSPLADAQPKLPDPAFKTPSERCPDGWVPIPRNLNPALGRCMPGTIKAPSHDCPDGWVPIPPDVNPALGPCMPGEVVAASPAKPPFVAINPSVGQQTIDASVWKVRQAPPDLPECPDDQYGYFLAEVDGEYWWILCDPRQPA